MKLNERFSSLPAYPFSRLRTLFDGQAAGGDVLDLALGQPRHSPPDFVGPVLLEHIEEFRQYPPNPGAPDLLASITGWIETRYGVALDPDRQVMAVNGSREGLFNACLALCPDRKTAAPPLVAMPNPFYQVYAGAAAAAGARPVLVPATAENMFLPDFGQLDRSTLDRIAIAYICSPSNPQGTVASSDWLASLIRLAEAHDFLVFSDECYSELYRRDPPPGILEVADNLSADPERVLAFNSLSKRSNLPGLRSGFVAGGPETIGELRKLRAYGGAPLPLPIQRVSARAWADEAHVEDSRAEYIRKYELADDVFSELDTAVYRPIEAGMFLWIRTGDGEATALDLWRSSGIRVLPGEYLSGPVEPGVPDPARPFIRVSITHGRDRLETGLRTLRTMIPGG